MPPHQPLRLEVLVVDDESDIRDLLVEFFRERGHIVSTAGDGRAAITAIERAPARYGLILADLNLPGANGLAVLEAAKRANPSCYVVIVTGYASLDSAIEAVRLGAYDYLTKPFSLGQLDIVLRRIADRSNLETENRKLTRQIGNADGVESASPFLTRLEGIESRLGQIELLLRELTDSRAARSYLPLR